MTLKRRRFLYLGGAAIGGFGIGTTVHRAFSQSAQQPVTPTSTSPLDAAVEPVEPAAIASPTAAAPAGLYAPQRGDVRLIVFSDLNGPYRSTDYIREVQDAVTMLPDWQPDLVLCSGDMVAGQLLSLTTHEIQAMWAGFDRHVFQPIRQANLPYIFTLGNHDASSAMQNGSYVFGLERDLAAEYWAAHPSLGAEIVDGSGFPFYYSALHNQIFYLIWDASSSRIAPEQLAWAEQSLASDVAQQAKLRLVIGHLPLYAISQGRDRAGEFLDNADQVRSLLERHQVHTYICGHHHAYYPARVGNLEVLHCGALGSGPRTWLDSTATAMHTLTVVDVNLAEGSTVYTTYNMTTREVVDLAQLPRQIVGPNGRELRRDLTWDDLTPAEQNQQHVYSS